MLHPKSPFLKMRGSQKSLSLEGTYGEHPVQPPLLKQGQQNQVAQDHVMIPT